MSKMLGVGENCQKAGSLAMVCLEPMGRSEGTYRTGVDCSTNFRSPKQH